VQTETAPTREEAVELVWPAIWEETRRALGEALTPEARRRSVVRSVGDVVPRYVCIGPVGPLTSREGRFTHNLI
jgi:hypothetical protein